MNNLYARCVFFVKDAERALQFYTESLGFSVEWKSPAEGKVFVFEVGLFGFQLILNQIESDDDDRAGQGRVFIGLEVDQIQAFLNHLQEKKIPTTVTHWGGPTMVIRDLDENELYFWFPEKERALLQTRLAQAGL